jgi:ribosomal protein S18 acetylase RimI-like enzyme
MVGVADVGGWQSAGCGRRRRLRRYGDHVTLIEPAAIDDIDSLVALESKLFLEDAGRHDRYADVTWPTREGRRDFVRLMADPASLVLVARDGTAVVGLLVAFISEPTPTRQPVRYAVLRSMYVDRDRRRRGLGHLLTEQFVSWARTRGCVEAHVDSYVANGAAQDFYEQLGFASRSLSRVLTIYADGEAVPAGMSHV